MRTLLFALLVLPFASLADIAFPVDPGSTWTVYDLRDGGHIVNQYVPAGNLFQKDGNGDLVDWPPGFDHINYTLLLESRAEQPAVDPRRWNVVPQQPDVDLAANTIAFTWSQQERPENELLAAVDAEEASRHGIVANPFATIRANTVYAGLLYKLTQGVTLGPAESAFLTRMNTRAQRIKENYIHLRSMKQAVRDHVANPGPDTFPDLDVWPWEDATDSDD